MKIGIKKMLMLTMMGGLMMMGMNGNTAAAASPNGNPFGLVYGNAIEKNEPGKVNIRPVEYEVDGIKVSAISRSLPMLAIREPAAGHRAFAITRRTALKM